MMTGRLKTLRRMRGIPAGFVWTAIAVATGVGERAVAQPCTPAWTPGGFDLRGGGGGEVYAMTVFDDGTGPALYVGGIFNAAGSVAPANIAKWDGAQWSTLGDGFNDWVLALAVFDDGSGPALYAAGGFTMSGGTAVNHIAKWNGTQWLPLGEGLNSDVQALAVFDPPGAEGPGLYAGGWFTAAGGAPASRIARWDGTQWSALGDGTNNRIYALAVYDPPGEEGPALYVGGAFYTAGGTSAQGIAKWDGTQWSGITGLGTVRAMAVFDDGNGSALYVGGEFSGTVGYDHFNHIAKWDGSQWSTLDTGMDGWVWALGVFDDGSGSALYAGGWFETAGGVLARHIAKWDGSQWSAVGGGIEGGYVGALAVFDPPGADGPGLYAGGLFAVAGVPGTSEIARWDGAAWSALDDGVSWTTVFAMTVFDPPGSQGGPALYAGGKFTSAGGGSAGYVAAWDGTGWSALGDGLSGPVQALTVFDPPGEEGLGLYAGVRRLVKRWDGAQWSAVGGGATDIVVALTVFDDGTGPALYAGGQAGSSGSVVKWDGTQWTKVGDGLTGYVYALAVFDDGSGPALYAGGYTLIGPGDPVTNSGIAKWNGTEWSQPGGNTGHGFGYVDSLVVFDPPGAEGSALYAGGLFSSICGVAASNIAKWDGTQWSALGSGLTEPLSVGGTADALAVFDDGTGPALYAAGRFGIAGGVAANNIAKWDGSAWSAVGSGTNGQVRSLTVFPDAGGPALYAGGDFTVAGGQATPYLARWGSQTVRADLECDTDVDGFDFLTFATCYNGSDRAPSAACETAAADIDLDGDVDGFDFLTFANCYNGPDRAPLCP